MLLKIIINLILSQVYLFSDFNINIVKSVNLIGGDSNQQFLLKSKFNKQEYLIQVYVPKIEASKDGYNIIYLLDGNATFPYASLMAQIIENANSKTNQIPPLIVSVGYKTQKLFDIESRSYDYTPSYKGILKERANSLYSYRQGGAEEFYRFLNEQLKPFIQNIYKINPKHQTIYGHSYGGLFVLYTYLNHPNSFQFYMASSPSIWWNDYQILKQAKNLKSKLSTNNVLWLCVGEIENKQNKQSNNSIAKKYDIEQFTYDLSLYNKINIKTFVIKDAKHIETLFPGIDLAFKLQN